ncbi:MAG: hypothetical protein HYX66_08860 [Ignavibacteria bacterium]|nr:hypothetical protein [Ignavibacteria bacterium]
MNMHVEHIKLTPRYLKFVGRLPKNSGWSMQVSGAPGTGKSTWLLLWANELSRHGRVLYATAEELHASGTIQERIKMTGVKPYLVVMPEVETLSQLRQYLDSGRYDFAIVDSINALVSTAETEGEDISDADIIHLAKLYKDIGFTFAAQTTKNRKVAAGRSTNEHNVMSTFMTEKRGNDRFICHTKNRFGATESEFFIFSGT